MTISLSLPFPDKYRWAITQSFEQHKKNSPGYNPGEDFGLPAGTDITPAAVGKVTWAGVDPKGHEYNGGYGQMVTIDHGGYTTIYAHLSNVKVKFGQQVEPGQIIGKSGNTGNSTGPHLHFELRINGRCVDPEIYWPKPGKVQSKPGLPAVLIPHLNIRLQPSTLAEDVGDLVQGQQIELTGEPIREGGIVWRKAVVYVAQSEDGDQYIG